ncbi:hypothetical protein GCM10027168_44920 [Streptomyces capparidis]
MNRVVEIHGLAGSIGEQLTLAWAAEQDAQRWQSPDVYRDPEHLESLAYATCMAIRALCEMSTHFLLGAAHSLANLVLRVVLCDPAAAAVVNTDKRNSRAQGFPPGSDLKAAWLTFSPAGEVWAKTLPQAAAESGLQAMSKLVERLLVLRRDVRFEALDDRRGTDYHRHRPQSVKHTSPRVGIWSRDETTGVSRTVVVGANEDARRDEAAVHRICVEALSCIHEAMTDLEPLIAEALEACHLVWAPKAL